MTPQEPAQTLGQREQEQFQQELQALRSIVERQDGRLNIIDQRSAHTRDQVQKAQQLEASKQAIVSSWPVSAGPQDRSQAVEYMVNRHEALKGKYASTTTLRSKSGWSQSSIVEFFTKEARNEFLDSRLGQERFAHLPRSDSSRTCTDPEVPASGRPTA